MCQAGLVLIFYSLGRGDGQDRNFFIVPYYFLDRKNASAILRSGRTLAYTADPPTAERSLSRYHREPALSGRLRMIVAHQMVMKASREVVIGNDDPGILSSLMNGAHRNLRYVRRPWDAGSLQVWWEKS
jgi:hypothetical protein